MALVLQVRWDLQHTADDVARCHLVAGSQEVIKQCFDWVFQPVLHDRAVRLLVLSTAPDVAGACFVFLNCLSPQSITVLFDPLEVDGLALRDLDHERPA